MSFQSFFLAVVGTGTLLLSSCNNTQTSTEASAPATTPAAASTDTTALPASGAVYTCPMHPEVVSDKPGECPKCGMTLEKKS